MMCWMQDDVTEDVSNLQTGRLKSAVQPNTCLLLSLSLPAVPAISDCSALLLPCKLQLT